MSNTIKSPMADSCNCGKPNRYMHKDFVTGKIRYSCNKYGVCATYDQLQDENWRLKKLVEAYSAKREVDG